MSTDSSLFPPNDKNRWWALLVNCIPLLTCLPRVWHDLRWQWGFLYSKAGYSNNKPHLTFCPLDTDCSHTQLVPVNCSFLTLPLRTSSWSFWSASVLADLSDSLQGILFEAEVDLRRHKVRQAALTPSQLLNWLNTSAMMFALSLFKGQIIRTLKTDANVTANTH